MPWHEHFDHEFAIPDMLLYILGVRSIFCGHYHGNAGGFDEGMEVIVTSAIGAQLREDKSGLRIVKVLENEINHQYYELDNIPQKVNLDS